MLDNLRWNKLVSALCKGHTEGHWFLELAAAYGENHRYYHGINHITHCLKEFDQVKKITQKPYEVEFAIWLHDAVYNPQASDNEEKSAFLAVKILSSLGAYEAVIQRIKHLILSTRHNGSPFCPDAELLVDIDLSTLGQPPELYNEYESAIRAEYAWVPPAVYREARRQILHNFLKRHRIYYTGRFYDLYEKQARDNIQRVLNSIE